MHPNGHAYTLLAQFVGTWNTSGVVLGTVPVKIAGTDTYEWLPGEYFLLHHVDVRIGGEAAQSVEIIGYDRETHSYPMHYFNNKGDKGIMQATYADSTWNFLSETMRFAGKFSDDGKTLSGTWETFSAENGWVPWMEVRLIRV